MPFELTLEEELTRNIVQKFAQREIIPHRNKLKELDEAFEDELFKKTIAAGFHLSLVPRKSGGTGLGHIARSIIFEELVAAWPLVYGHMDVEWAYYLARGIGGDVEKKWMARILKGEARASPLVNESSGGSDILGFTTSARKEGDNWIISGRKCFIRDWHVCDFGVVLAKTGDPNAEATRGYKAFTAFVVEKGMPGLRIARLEKAMWSTRSYLSEVILDNVKVPDSYIAGGVGQGMKALFSGVGDIGRLGISALLNGSILGCCQCSIKFAKERILYGKPITELQGIQWRLADMFIDLEASRSLAYRAGWMRNKNQRCDTEQVIAKYFATQAALRSSLHAVNIHGGCGVTEDYMPQAYYRFVPPMISSGGTDEALKIIISRSAIDQVNPDMGSLPAEQNIL